jgi:hypothetical protein
MALAASLGAPRRAVSREKERSIHPIRSNLNIVSMKVFGELRGGARGHRAQSYTGLGVNTALETSQQRIVEAPVSKTETTGGGSSWNGTLLARQLLQTMEKRVNDNYIGVGTVDTGGKDEIETEAAESRRCPTRKAIEEKPRDVGEEQWRAGDRGNWMPEDDSLCALVMRGPARYGKIFDTLGEEMNFAPIVAGQPLEQFGDRAFRAMTAIDKWRYDGEAQISGSWV